MSSISDTGTWNVAKPYIYIKVMKWLALIDEFETIAKFGTSELIEEFTTSEEMRSQFRIKALKRFHFALLKLLKNTKFAVKTQKKGKFGDDKQTIANYITDLETLEESLDKTYLKTFNESTKVTNTIINDKIFDYILKLLSSMASDILDPLNRADLIFVNVENLDPDELKAQLTEDLINAG